MEASSKFVGANAAGDGTGVSSLSLLTEQIALPSCSASVNVGAPASLPGSGNAPSAETPVGYRGR